MRLTAILVAAAALFFAGCNTTQPVQDVQQAPVVLLPGKTANLSQVQAAILRAGTRLGWQMQPQGQNRIAGRLALREHTALVDIEYNTQSYSIKYKDSTNLNAKDGMIHRNYNGWVQNLDKSIRTELLQI